MPSQRRGCPRGSEWHQRDTEPGREPALAWEWVFVALLHDQFCGDSALPPSPAAHLEWEEGLVVLVLLESALSLCP